MLSHARVGPLQGDVQKLSAWHCLQSHLEMYEFLLSQHADVFRLPEATQPMQMRCRQALGTFWRGIFPFCRERGRSWMKYSKLNIKNLINGSSLADSPADICPAAERSEGQKQKRIGERAIRAGSMASSAVAVFCLNPLRSQASWEDAVFLYLALSIFYYFISSLVKSATCNAIKSLLALSVSNTTIYLPPYTPHLG